MKKLSFLVLVLVSSYSINVLTAQTSAKTDDGVDKALCCSGKMNYNIPDLSDDQKKKIEELQIAHLKEVNQTKALLNEKKAHLRTLQVADKPDNAAINKTIDEITSLKNELMKKHEAHRQAVRSLLTEKQRTIFDAKGCCSPGKEKCCHGKEKGKGCSSMNEQSGCSGQQSKGKGCCHKN